MGDYPDPDEEYELMYADDLELVHEDDEHDDANTVRKKSLPAKRSLDFSSPATKKISAVKATTNTEKITEEISLTPQLQPMEDLETITQVNVSSKRTTEDLFGDIGDIDFDDIQQPSKKQKTEEEVDLELINKIVEGRKLRQLLLEPNNRQNGNSKQNYNAKDNLSLNIPRWAFMPLTNSDGDRVYVRLESEEYWDSSLSAPEDYISLHSSYLSTWEEARKILEAKQQEVIRQSQEPLPDVDSDLENSALWVDKYRPESYVDLLSEEPVNRALLHWLHLWDKVVFKKEVKTKDPQQRSTFSKRAGQFQLSNKWRGKKESEPEMDPDGRPHHKVALLCGPPGVGKTTLAHLLARLAGYRPVELNASDERSVEAFRNALQAATLMRAVLDKERRPNCLVLDEIDGAPLPTVELLVKWCGATAADAGKKKPKSQPLKRPVIAICNDLYASSLRPLRPVSLIIHVGGVSLSRLAARLSLVCERERVSAAAALPALAARANGDVRAAIQLLSFVRRKGQLTIKDVENSAIGTKDCTKTMMQALKAVFTVNDSDPTAAGKVIQAAGEYDRLMDGIFENYLSSRVDSRLHLACEALSWLCLHDLINSWTMRSQNYSLYGMLPLCGVRCHQLLAARHYQRIAFPTAAQEVYRRKTECESVTWSVSRGRAASITASKAALQRDILPLLPYLLAPNLRSANVQLCSDTELAALRTAAGAMCDYGLTYAQRRGQDGLYHHALEPDVTRVAFYGNEERIRTPPAVKQAISREQQLEMIRRTEEMASRVVPRSNTADAAKKPDGKAVKLQSAQEPPSETRLPNHLQRLKPKDLQKSTPQVHKDFFGRIVPLSQVQKNDAVPDVISSSGVFYQYREGFNNAVRRNVRTKDLL